MTDVSVPQKDGEIVLTTNGDPAVVLPVTKGKIAVPDEHLDTVLANVVGAQIVAASGKAEGNSAPV